MQIIASLKGTEEILNRLQKIPKAVGDKAMRRALRKGANQIRNLARRYARKFDDPATPDPIWQNIITASGGKRRERREGGIVMRIGVRGGAKSGKSLVHAETKANDKKNRSGRVYELYHWRFLEFGTSQMKAQPFMRPALVQGQEKAIQKTLESMKVEADKEILKLGAK